MITSWIQQQTTPVYWLATASTFREATRQQDTIDDASRLFYGQAYESVTFLSPWLVPASSLTDIDEDTLKKGMFLCCEAPENEMLSHLRSLLVAMFMGKKVPFRFYDPKVIIPMLEVMNDTDRRAFMGNVQSWSHGSGELMVTYTTCRLMPMTAKYSPWWIIKDEHLREAGDVDRMAAKIEGRLWAKMPKIMSRLVHPRRLIINTLQQAREDNLSDSEAQLSVMARIAFLMKTTPPNKIS